ncbi:MAG TPA: hypothetical protein VK083_21310 [Nocardia sp.]|uniref:DUF6879 family protein n=1 Tax=Nocardia TaxID=1817 RepID=UPI002454E0E1|nr:MULTISPECIES: DUF6879 family protein [Nocardia]HLS79328.1 hypothetical protein [Nocardia sp.]
MRYLPLDPPDWAALLRGCESDAFHLESRDSYAVPAETARLQRFLSGEPALPDEPKARWNALVRETTGRGVAVRRVRVVSVPHSDYHRWLLSVTDSNTAAGEDIRYVPRDRAGEVPADDWWLLDDRRVVFNLTDEHDGPAGLAVTTDPGLVAHCRAVRDRLWDVATPYEEYRAP